jgi:predicted RNA polymerase sigma factor
VTPDEIGKAITPNALRDASVERLDDICNHANSLLLSPDAGEARQMQAAIQAIHAEKGRRESRKSKWIEWAILIATLLGVAVAVIALYRTAK